MPIPTDTFWNIRKLNVIFALSALSLVGVCGWAIKQDFEKSWRPIQVHSFVWEAALSTSRADHLNTPVVDAEIKALTQSIQSAQAVLEKNPDYTKLLADIQNTKSSIANLEFKYNNDKATVGVAESDLQTAITQNKTAEIARLRGVLSVQQKDLAAQAEAIAKLKSDMAGLRNDAKTLSESVEKLKKERKSKSDDIETLRKKAKQKQPTDFVGKISNTIRNAPMLGFVNPSLRVQPIFVADHRMDVSFMTIDTIDRCMTCHTQIDNKQFSRERVHAYLEETMASKRQYRYLEKSAKDPDYKPGEVDPQNPSATAMPEFWHLWARKLLTPASLDKAKGKVKGIYAAIGEKTTKKITVNYKDKEVTTEDLKNADLVMTNPGSIDPKELSKLDDILMAAINALYQTNPSDVKLAPRNLALGYPVQLQQMLKAELSADEYRLLEDRYRHALIAEINPWRAEQSLPALDPSPVHFAHPKLELYADDDSKHPKKLMGCTTCHDGSGNETDFVLTAHAPRSIWVNEKTGEPVLAAQLLTKKSHPKSEHATSEVAKKEGTATTQPADHSSDHKTDHIAAVSGHASVDGDGHNAEHGAHDLPTLSSALDAVYPPSAILPKGVANIHLNLSKHDPSANSSAPVREKEKAEVPHDAPPVEFTDPVTGETGRAVSQIHYWSAKYESESGTTFKGVEEMWDRPMLSKEMVQANCSRCHNNFHDIKAEAPMLHEGRVLFNKVGCSNCHQMDSIGLNAPDEFIAKNTLPDGTVDTTRRRVGTDLRHISSKLSKEFVSSWIWAPKAFRPSTLMPHFFMLENCSSDEEIRRTRQEVRAMTEYLFEVSTPLAPKHVVPAKSVGNVDKGRELFQNVGCQGCHSNLNETGEAWIVTDLVKRYNFKEPEAKKQYTEMTYNERHLYALEHLGEVTSSATEQKKYSDGKTPIPVFMHHAPELSGIGDKLTAGRTMDQAQAWLYDWLKEPRHYSAYTVMPRMRLTDEQATDLSAYLLAQKRALTAPEGKSQSFDGWEACSITPDGAKISELVSWFLRSQYSAETSNLKAVDDKEMTQRAVDVLTYISTATDEPREADESKAKAMAKKRAADRVKDKTLEQKQMIFLGSKLVSHYGCMNCHTINGMENVASPCANLSEWGQKQVSKLDFGFLSQHKVHTLPPISSIPMVNGLCAKSVSEISKEVESKNWKNSIAQNVEVGWPILEESRESWLKQKIKNSRIFDRGKNGLDPVRKMENGVCVVDKDGNPEMEKLGDMQLRGKPYDKIKMPTFYLNDRETQAIATFVLSNRKGYISDRLLAKSNTPELKSIAHGRQIAERYNCVGCHQVETNFPAVKQYYNSEIWMAQTPPSLRGEGNKVQHSWLFGFFKNVELIRPSMHMRISSDEKKEGIRMPSFALTDDECTALADYFAAASNHEAKELHARLDAVVKEYDKLLKLANVTNPDPEKSGEFDNWIDKEINATAKDYLRTWALDHRFLKESAFDSKVKPEEIKLRYREALYRARFVMDLYEAPYPFNEPVAVDQTNKTQADARFKQGETLFYEMQCMKCHYIGDMNAPGANNKPSAPNLAGASRRLQRRWIWKWIQEPSIIQLDTLMPPFFGAMSANPAVMSLEGQPWPLGGGGLKDDVAKTFAKYHLKDIRDEKNLLLDYIYSTGQKQGYSAVQPPDATTQPTTAPTTGGVGTPATAPTNVPATTPATAPATGPTTIPGITIPGTPGTSTTGTGVTTPPIANTPAEIKPEIKPETKPEIDKPK